MTTATKGPAWADEEHAVSVTAADGQIFSCWAEAVPGGAMVAAGNLATVSNIRWVFRDSKGVTRLGPPVNDPESTVGDLLSILENWRSSLT
jgi:hypothetical protein